MPGLCYPGHATSRISLLTGPLGQGNTTGAVTFTGFPGGRIFSKDRDSAEWMEGLPSDPLRVFHPILVRLRITASRASLIQGSDVGAGHLLAQAGKFFIRIHLKAEVIHTGKGGPVERWRS